MYTTALNIDDFLHDTQRPAAVVISGRKFYDAIRDGVSGFLATFLLAFAMPFAWLFIYIFRYRLQKRIPNGIKLTSENYAQVRSAYDTLLTITDDLQKIQTADIKNIPFWLRGFFREIQRFCAVICQVNDSIKTALDDMNNDYPTSTQNVFQPISDDVLWQNRPKVYQYRL